MTYERMKRLKGLVYIIAFIIMALSFQFESRGVSDVMEAVYGIPVELWSVMFAASAVFAFVQVVLKQKWNFITFTPYFMYSVAILLLRLNGASNTAWSSIAIIMTLSLLMLIDLIYDWR